MTKGYWQCFFGIGIAIAGALLVQAQELRTAHFEGVVSDYSPSTVSGGPYEIRGAWSVDVDRAGTGNFTADLAMETSDYGISNATAVDPTNPATRSPHTHHLSMTHAVVSYDPSVCPVLNPVASGSAVVITGSVTTTGNGGPAAFESKGASTLQVCITGGSEVAFANMTMVYTGPATGHFGPQPIHGVVSKVSTQ